MKYKLSVIIPFFYPNNQTIDVKKYFSLLSFEKCLAAVFKSDYKNFEVIAVSDASSLESVEIAKKYPCKILNLKKNSGAGYARNKGSDFAKGEILVFLDSDVEIQKNALKIIDKHFNKKNNYGLLQGIYSHKPNYESSSSQYLQSYYSYYLFTETKKNKFTETLCTNFFAIKKSIFKKNKGFDHQFSSATAEDQEFGFRLIKKGLKIPIERKLNTVHHANLDIWGFMKKITNIHIGEMKMHLRNKTILMRTKQSNYSNVLLGMALVSIMIALSILNFIIDVPYFNKIIVGLNILFLSIHLNFLRFIFSSKGITASIKAIFYIYLHRLLHINCAASGMVDFYLLRNKY